MMKKTMLFAAVCVTLAACTNNIDITTPETRNAETFECGQTVTLSVNTSDRTKVTSELATSGTDKDKINFVWEAGDKIKVSVGGASAEFSLTSGAGTSSATFTGTMPASGQSFDVQYPCSTPELSSQTYSPTEAIPHDKMLFSATACTLGTPFTLDPQYAALRLNLYGLNREVNQIVVSDTAAKPNVSCTLNCNSAVRVGNSAETATPFIIVVPEGSWVIKVGVTSAAATTNCETIPVYDEGLGFSDKGIIIPNDSFSTSLAQSFTAGAVLNMPAKPITIIWAPVNCGYEAANGEYKGYPYGRLYQWGRKYGHGYKDTYYEDDDYPGKTGTTAQTKVTISSTDELLKNHPDTADYNGDLYCVSTIDSKNWYNGLNADKLWNTNEGTSGPVCKSDYDPCPNGWRVPTKAELVILKGIKTYLDPVKGIHGTSELYGSKFDGGNGSSDNYVFLPIAGYLTLGGIASNRGSSFYYWSSTADGGKSWLLLRGGKMTPTAIFGVDGRAFGCSVRCVKE